MNHAFRTRCSWLSPSKEGTRHLIMEIWVGGKRLEYRLFDTLPYKQTEDILISEFMDSKYIKEFISYETRMDNLNILGIGDRN